MPLLAGKGEKVIHKNIRELHHGAQYQRTKRKFGKKKAHAQAVAIAFSKARESGRIK